jgi:hypothetical protein
MVSEGLRFKVAGDVAAAGHVGDGFECDYEVGPDVFCMLGGHFGKGGELFVGADFVGFRSQWSGRKRSSVEEGSILNDR